MLCKLGLEFLQTTDLHIFLFLYSMGTFFFALVTLWLTLGHATIISYANIKKTCWVIFLKQVAV